MAAHKAQPRDVDILGELATLARRRGAHDEAIARLSEAAEIAPDNAGLVGNLGNAYRAAGDLMAAADAHRRAGALDPGRGQSQFNRALALRDCGDFAGAEACFDDPLAHDYDKP